MKNRNMIYESKGTALLQLLSTYKVIKKAQLEKFYPDSVKTIQYLQKQNRIFLTDDTLYYQISRDYTPDSALISALWVLLDVFSKVTFHMTAEPPGQILFFTTDGGLWEIVYVPIGKETMISMYYQTKEAQTEHSHRKTLDTTIKRMVIIEDTKQIQQLQIPETARYCLEESEGQFRYFNNTGK